MNEIQNKERYALLPSLLLPWYRENARRLPWRETMDPYRVWVSEVMLQQTRVEAVRGYYLRFVSALPDIAALSRVPEDALLKLWEGLGYYQRARNLKRAAARIMEGGGDFPREYDRIRALPGIGDYTADAIASICFHMPTPAVDGNVLRVIARVMALSFCVDDPKVRGMVRENLRAVCPADAGSFTQALMELGATVCLPNGAPQCGVCPLGGICKAHRAGQEGEYPVRAKKRPRRVIPVAVFLLMLPDGRIALRKRAPKGLLGGLYELPNAEGVLTKEQALAQAGQWGVRPARLWGVLEHTHIFTHIEWRMTCFCIVCDEAGELFFADPKAYPLPSAFRPFLRLRAMQAAQEETREGRRSGEPSL